jgi:hypothetical protein
MEPLVFHHLEGTRSNMCRFSNHHNKSSLRCGNFKLERGQLGFISIKGAYIEMVVGTGMGNLTKLFRI